MRFFKTLLAIFLFIVGPIGEMIKDVLKTKIFEFFNFHPENISMSILFITSTAIGAFILGTEWHDWFKPITKFRWFLSLKIKQGKKIIKEENNGMPDKHQTDRLRLRHSRWYDTIRGAYRNAFKGSIDG
ncbi:MAG TPA: hypothetical protein VN963_06810, partial [bacterium]|nr:hypothetical protein [bacterium]